MSEISTPACCVRLSGTLFGSERKPRDAIGDETSREPGAKPPLHTLTIVSVDPSTEGAPPPIAIGSPEARYHVEDFIGEGGMGEVFRGEDSLLRRPIAVKYLRQPLSDDPSALRQFWNEVVHSGLLDHPCVPPVHDAGIDRHGRPFYVMRLIRGRSLRDVLDESDDSEWGLPRLLSSFVQVCGAVQFAHDSDILHLDIKPANIMIGDYGAVYLVDWGLSEATSPHGRRGTRGTPSYMAPEQTRSGAALSAAADLFALGALLYELCTRERAFPGSEPRAIFEKIRRGEFHRGPAWDRCAPSLCEIIEHALEPEIDRRIESAEAL
ncbi:MAG: serine/threonine protein kinase, partial [Planctomycetes bacterium]|nr:serine/threonine protein kinase [Planctomycetota bacterium]